MKRSDLPSFDDLRAFESVARRGSVRRAADELALTHGAVSRRVSKLSRDLQLSLFEPKGRGLRLTPDGQELAAAATKAMAIVADSLASIRLGSNANPIILSCQRTLSMRWLIPRLSAFEASHPGIEIHLAAGDGKPDFDRDRMTLAIRRVDFPVDPSWKVRDLMPERVGPVMHPAMRAGFEVGGFVALASQTRPRAWDAWLASHPGQPRPQSVRTLDHHFLMTEAALGGLGVAMAPEVLVRDDIRAGRLEAPLGFSPDGTRYGLIHPSNMLPPNGTEALCLWLVNQAERIEPTSALQQGEAWEE